MSQELTLEFAAIGFSNPAIICYRFYFHRVSAVYGLLFEMAIAIAHGEMKAYFEKERTKDADTCWTAMMEQNKYTLSLANQAIESGDYETFLSLCTEDTHWEFVGERTLIGKEAVRNYFREAYPVPPVFDVRQMFAEGDHVIAMGIIRLADGDGVEAEYEYCDVWELRGGKLHSLKAYVIEAPQK